MSTIQILLQSHIDTDEKALFYNCITFTVIIAQSKGTPCDWPTCNDRTNETDVNFHRMGHVVCPYGGPSTKGM